MSNEFEKIFEELARHDDPNAIFTNWLDFVIDQNLFTVKNRELNFKGNEEEYFNMFAAWVNLQHDYLESNPDEQWYDYLGLFYEDIIQSKYKAGSRGQFFTPSNVCSSMAKITFNNDVKSNLDGKLINDCACGSGRLLLASKVYAPNGIFIGQDLDSVACKMAALNFFIHGIRGSIICMNTLSQEFYEAYRVNNYLGWGVPVPHIELVDSIGEAYNLFGINKDNDNDSEIIEVSNNVDDVVVDNATIKESTTESLPVNDTNNYKPKGNQGQTTLF